MYLNNEKKKLFELKRENWRI